MPNPFKSRRASLWCPDIGTELELLILVYGLIGVAAAITAVSLIGPNIDLTVASLIYDPVTRQFPWNHPFYRLRDHGAVAVITCIACVATVFAKYLPWRIPSMPGRTAVYLTLSLLLGPGLLVNGILKEHWGRPRPIQVTQFGGTHPFVDWWNPAGTCPKNCSFVSGEAATAAWMFGPAMLVPPPWRGVALAAAAAFTALMGGLRMLAGSHFFTDVLFGALSTMLILLAMRALVYRLTDSAAGPGGAGRGSRAQPAP